MNQLHSMLAAGFVQSMPVLGDSFAYDGNNYTGFFSPADERLLMEVVGYLDESDTICVVSTAQFVALNVSGPKVKTTLIAYGAKYSIRGIKTDASAYILALKKISDTVGGFSDGFSKGFSGSDTKPNNQFTPGFGS